MIDFTGVTAITIPEGNVKKITRGATVLWEKPSGVVIVFPAADIDVTIIGTTAYVIEAIDLNRAVSTGEKYIIYINGTGHTATIPEKTSDATNGEYFLLTSDDGIVRMVSVIGDEDKDIRKAFIIAVDSGVTESTMQLEIHYIPE